jgi:hypothetical protein
MKTLINKSTKEYRYNCDRCNREISFKDKTMKQIDVRYNSNGANKTKKVCDLCNKCFKSLLNGVKKGVRTNDINIDTNIKM